MSFSSFLVTLRSEQDRVMITLTMLLTTVAFKNYVSSHLPNVNFVTWIDAYVLCCIFVILIVGLENMYMSHYLEYTGDDDGPETSPPAWWAWWHLDAEHANNIDTFAIFTTCWVCFHLGVIPLALHWHIKATRRVDKDWWSDMAVGDAVEAKRTNKGEGEGEGEAKAKGKSMGEGKGKVGQQRWVEWWDIGTIDRVNEDGTYDVVFTNHKHCPKETKNRSEVRLATAQGGPRIHRSSENHGRAKKPPQRAAPPWHTSLASLSSLEARYLLRWWGPGSATCLDQTTAQRWKCAGNGQYQLDWSSLSTVISSYC